MRFVIFITTVLFCMGGLHAKGDDPKYEEALRLKNAARYSEAVNCFLTVLKERQEKHEEAKKICFEIADCYAKDGNEGRALYFLKIAIYDYGATIEDFKKEGILKKDFLAFAWLQIEPNYNKLRRNYVAGLKNVDEYMNKKYITQTK